MRIIRVLYVAYFTYPSLHEGHPSLSRARGGSVLFFYIRKRGGVPHVYLSLYIAVYIFVYCMLPPCLYALSLPLLNMVSNRSLFFVPEINYGTKNGDWLLNILSR